MKRLTFDFKTVGEILNRDQLKEIHGGGALYFCTCAGPTGTSAQESFYCYHVGGPSFCEMDAARICSSGYGVCEGATYYA